MAYLTDLSANGQKVVKLLATYLGVAATNDLITAGAAAYTSGATDAAILDVLFAAPTVQAAQPKLGSNYSDTAFVTQMINNIVGAVTVDATVKAGWVTTYAAELSAGTYASRGAFAVHLGDVFKPATAPAAGTPEEAVYMGLDNRFEASAAYAQSSNGATFTTMTQVTTPVATVTDNVATIDDAIAASATVYSYTLTTGADTTLTGGAGNDVYTGAVGTDGTSANGTTLNAGDVVSGGAGSTDTLNLSISGTNTGAVTTAAFTMTGVENLNISNFEVSTNNNTLDMSQSSGVTSIKVTGSSATGDTSITNLAAIAPVEMGNGSGDLLLTYSSTPVAGSADAQTLTLKAQTGGTFQANGIETLNIDSGTSANTIAINDGSTATIATINVTGSQNLTLTEGATPDTAVTRIDASALTGKLAVTTGSVAQNMSITGGSANDTVTFSGNTFSSSDSVDGGSGTDTLSIATAITTATTLTNVTNVETLKITGANSVTLAANISATTIDTTDGSSIASTVTLNTGYTNATTVLMDANDVVVNSSANIALTAKFTAADAVTVTGGTGTDTLNITADDGTVTFASKITVVDSITIVDGGDATSTAGKDVTLSLGAYATALTIDASALDAAVSTATDATSENLIVDGSTVTKNLIITGGAGADSITGGTANDSINAGDGNDTITMGANLTSLDTIDGGSGTDTLAVTSLSASGLTNVTNVENLAMSGAASTATLSANLAFTTISLSQDTNVAQTLVLASGYTNATTVSVDAGDKITNTANVALSVSGKATNLEAADLVTITGGTGTDTLSITADGVTTSTGIVDFSNITSVNTVTIVDSGDSSSTAGGDVDLSLGSYATALTIDATAMDAANTTFSGAFATDEVLVVTGASVTKALTISVGAGGSTITTGTAASNDVVTGGSGVDAITSGAGNDSYSLGAGNDTINMSSYFDNNDTIAGGDGTDTLSVNAGASDTSFINVSGVEGLTLLTAGTTTLSTYANTAGITTITGFASTANTVVATGMTSSLTINAATTASISDALTGGSGNDNFKFTNITTTAPGFETADSVTGGTGTDTLTLTFGTATSAFTAATLTNVASIEAITVTQSATGTTAAISLTSLNANFVSVTGAAISASGIAGSATFSFNGTDEGSDSTFVITGGKNNNTLIGGAGADTITGGAAADQITGGTGADVMTGGAGADTFVYNSETFATGSVSPAVVYYGGTVVAGTSVSTSGLDKIADFGTGSDTINYNSSGSTTSTTTNAVGSIWSAVAGYLRGAYDSTAQTFTFATSGVDTLFVYDYDNSTSTNDLRGIVLVGYVDSGTVDSISGSSTGLNVL